MMPVVLVVCVPALLNPALLDDGFVFKIEFAPDDGVKFRVVLFKPLAEPEPTPE
jgi:hypothetical protein